MRNPDRSISLLKDKNGCLFDKKINNKCNSVGLVCEDQNAFLIKIYVWFTTANNS